MLCKAPKSRREASGGTACHQLSSQPPADQLSAVRVSRLHGQPSRASDDSSQRLKATA